MSRLVERAFEMAAATFPRAPRDRLAHPFGFDQHDPYRWRVSQDVWDALMVEVCRPETTWKPDARLLGEPIEIDSSLPPNSMLLEPVVASMVANDAAPSVG